MTSSTDPVARTRATYDRIAASYAARVRTPYDGLVEEVVDFVHALAGDPPVVLDAGAGPGHHSALLVGQGARVVSLDLSRGMLQAGSAALRVQADMRALPIGTGSVDGIWCSAALLHVPRGDVPGVLAGFARVARPGARLALTVFEGDGEAWEPHSPHGAGTPRFFVRHREHPLRAVLEAAGWQVGRVGRRRSHRDWLTLHATRE